jgi:hypothetical protein
VALQLRVKVMLVVATAVVNLVAYTPAVGVAVLELLEEQVQLVVVVLVVLVWQVQFQVRQFSMRAAAVLALVQ